MKISNLVNLGEGEDEDGEEVAEEPEASDDEEEDTLHNPRVKEYSCWRSCSSGYVQYTRCPKKNVL